MKPSAYPRPARRFNCDMSGFCRSFVAERKLRQIHRQVFAADLMIGAHNAAFQKRPERLNRVCVNVAAHILARAVNDGLMCG